MTSLQPHASTVSGPIIEGDFYLLGILEDSVVGYSAAVEVALSRLIDEESKALSSRLSAHPDWNHLSDKAEVNLTSTGLEYAVHDDVAADLEYGNPQTNITATGLVRSVAKRRSFDLTKRLMEHIARGLPNG